MNEKQVDKNHYEFCKYVDIQRFSSYYYQIEQTLELVNELKENGKSPKVLVVGKGDGIVPTLLEMQNVAVDTFDYDEELDVTYCGDVSKIAEIVEPGKYDIIICCQVLEHLKWDKFEMTIKQFN